MVNRTLLAVFISLMLISSAFPQIFQSDSLPKYSYSTVPEFWNQMEDIFKDPNFNNAHWGVVIQSLETGEYFYKRNEDKLFMPASNLKLFTTAAGLQLLSPDYRFSTNIYVNGKVDGSVLLGDLIVQGRGDPTISGRYFNGDIFKVYNDWADSLLSFGIDEIRGNIIGDDNEFDNKGLGNGWAWDYESYWYSAPSGAISFNDNCVDLSISADKTTRLSKITASPDTRYVTILNNVITVPNDSITSVDVYRERGTNVINVFGTIKYDNDSVKTYVTINNPTQYAMVVLKDVLLRKGIYVKGYALDVDEMSEPLDYSVMTKIAATYSPPLKEIIKVINKNSQNFFAEQLLKIIGLEKEYFGSAENGIKASKKIFEEMGMNTENMILADGSGLSRLNLVTPKQVVSLLNYMFKSEYFIPFFNSLPIAGVDGTLGQRMKNSKAAAKIRAKTGYIGSARSLSGYAYTADNEPIAFSMIANNFTVPLKLAENIQDLVCLRLANFKRK